MAEGFLRRKAGHLIDVRSAGSRPSGQVHPRAIEVMKEVGIDISGHRSKPVEPFLKEQVQVAIHVCAPSEESCPAFPPATLQRRWSFPDPASARGSDAEALARFREVRDAIGLVAGAWVDGLQDGRRLL